ncbi:MAG: LysR family transcriptional regulator [Myxococcales bacterium]|nr:LysR family transcriptional regulator [Myxococcales bacterium]
MDIPWEDVRTFLAIAESGSISSAARLLRLGQPTVSRHLADLERLLGYPLFDRSAQGVRLTDRGSELLEPARRMAEWAGVLALQAESRELEPAGVVRITAPPGVAYGFLAPFAADLARRWPELQLHVLSSVHYADLVRREADLALRWRPPTQRDLLSFATLTHHTAAMATPEYAAKLPEGYGLADVGWVGWAPPFDRVVPNSILAELIPNFRPVFASDDYLVQLRAAQAGVGGIFLGRVEHRYLRQDMFVELELDLGEYATNTLHLVAAKSALDVPRIRRVAERLAEELAATRCW